jgi:hypothetical protein
MQGDLDVVRWSGIGIRRYPEVHGNKPADFSLAGSRRADEFNGFPKRARA